MITEKQTRILQILISLSIIIQIQAIAQNTADYFSKPDIRVNGQSPLRITSITQDHIGNIWLSSRFGLLKSDGFETEVFRGNSDDSIFFDALAIEKIYCDYMGHIWIGNRLGVARYDPYSHRLFRYELPKSKNSTDHWILDFTEDPDSNLWMISASSGLLKFDRKRDQLIGFLNDRRDSIHILDDIPRVILSDKNCNIWIGTGFGSPENGQGLVRFSPKSGRAKRFLHSSEDEHSLLDNRVSALYEDQSGQLMVGTYQSGLHLYHPEDETFERLLYDPEKPQQLHAPTNDMELWGQEPFVKIIHQDRRGGYWIGATGIGLRHFDYRRHPSKLDLPNDEESILGSQQVWTFFEDRQSNLWLGSLDEGVSITDLFKPQFKEIKTFPSVVDIYESPFQPGTLWIGTFQGLFRWNVKSDVITPYLLKDTEKTRFSNSQDIFQENDSILWIGLGANADLSNPGDGRGGLVRLNQYQHSTTFFPLATVDAPGFNHTVFNIDQDHEGHLWISTGRALFRSNKSKTSFTEIRTPGKDQNDHRLFWTTRKGPGENYWVMTALNDSSGTLYRYDYEQKNLQPFLEDYHVTNILEDDRGAWWISTFGKGILRYDLMEQKYERFTTKDGLPSHEWLFIIKDSSGILWTNSLRGPARIDPSTQTITPLKHINTTDLGHFSIGDIVTSDNYILMELHNRIISFKPEEITGNPFPPEIKISKFIASDSLNAFFPNRDQRFSLSYKQNDIHIQYAGIHFSAPEDNVYQYQLLPVDKNWIDAGHERNARYKDLQPGAYTFRVKASNNNGVWTDNTIELPFTINPPWWKTWWAYLIFSTSFIGAVLGFIQYRSHAILKENKLLEKKVSERTETLEVRTHELEESLDNLKIAQQKLIQSEKLASLGELTAGIAHEIQNPLNFVNNFSEISQELLDEIKTNLKDEESLEIAEDLSANLNKILHHGKRADSIVKGMLLHSRSTSSHKEWTDIKKIIDEYLRLAYHGLRAKDKSFNAHIQTSHDENVSSIMISQSEIGRVLLNLISNAFYAVHERSRTEESNYEPLIQIFTQDLKDHISVVIEDNGIGIPEKIKDKIFQPFFSTKPTGEGTGLGLSLAFDIVTKGHQGEILVESEEGVGTEFQIILPKNPKI